MITFTPMGNTLVVFGDLFVCSSSVEMGLR